MGRRTPSVSARVQLQKSGFGRPEPAAAVEVPQVPLETDMELLYAALPGCVRRHKDHPVTDAAPQEVREYRHIQEETVRASVPATLTKMIKLSPWYEQA